MIHPIVLENERVRLSPLTLENFHELLTVASEPGLIKYSPSVIDTAENLQAYVQKALNDQEENRSQPFVIFDKAAASFAGCTRYMHIDWTNLVLHIGSTWIGRDFQGTGLNKEMKHLLINHAFNSMDFEKVEFRIDERNTRSRKAVEKLGAKLEGILRENVYLSDGFKRNTCCYGILKKEWKKTI